MDGVTRTAPSLIVGLLVGSLFGYWLRGAPQGEAPKQEEPAQVARVTPKQAPHPIEAPRVERAAPAERHDEAEAGPYERALRVVADYAGEGLLRCDVGEMMEDGPATGLRRAHVEGGVLIAAVEDPSGRAKISLPGDPPNAAPRAVVRWSGAWPGESGRCQVLAPERITVSGRVLVDGQGVQAEVGNAVEGTVRTGPDGSFVAECWLGADCPLAARRSFGQPWGPFETVVADGPVEGIALSLTAEPERDLKTFLEDQVAEDERLARSPDPLALALSDPTLPDEAKDLVSAWLDEQSEARQIAKTLLADVSSR